MRPWTQQSPPRWTASPHRMLEAGFDTAATLLNQPDHRSERACRGTGSLSPQVPHRREAPRRTATLAVAPIDTVKELLS
jgi:hypothetical protein